MIHYKDPTEPKLRGRPRGINYKPRNRPNYKGRSVSAMREYENSIYSLLVQDPPLDIKQKRKIVRDRNPLLYIFGVKLKASKYNYSTGKSE